MNNNFKTANAKTAGETENSNQSVSSFKPLVSIRRKQTRRLITQVDQERADRFDDYVKFVSECHGYEVSAGDVMSEILKAHFGRDAGFKQWCATKNDNALSTI